jgi:hypothetical protein
MFRTTIWWRDPNQLLKRCVSSTKAIQWSIPRIYVCLHIRQVKVEKGKSIPIKGRGGPQVCETSRLSHFLDNQFKDGSEVVKLTRRPPFTLRKIPGAHFCYRLSRPQDHSAAQNIRLKDKSSDLIRNRTRDLVAYSIVPQPTTLPRAQLERFGDKVLG